MTRTLCILAAIASGWQRRLPAIEFVVRCYSAAPNYAGLSGRGQQPAEMLSITLASFAPLPPRVKTSDHARPPLTAASANIRSAARTKAPRSYALSGFLRFPSLPRRSRTTI